MAPDAAYVRTVREELNVGIVLGWIFEALVELAIVGFWLDFHEKHPRLANFILAILFTLVAGLLVWAFWIAPA